MTKISVVFWTAYLLSLIILWYQGIDPNWLMAIIPSIFLCISSWLEHIADLIFNDEETLAYLFGDKWDEIKEYFEDNEGDEETNPEDETKSDAEDDSEEKH